MKASLKPLEQQVMVITGASSGIGLATAHEAARRGARLVLAARNKEVLQQTADEINAAGGEAIHVVVDVGQREDMQRLADMAIARFGGFDTWVNNAGVTIYGRLDEVSDEDHQKLFQTNFWGVVYGSLVASEHLRRRGGALINVGSVLSDQAIPIQGMYCASKHAVKGFTDALRMELEAENAPISVTLIKPAAINTPYTQHARNYLSEEPGVPPPVYAPEEVAYAILHAATYPKRDIFVGGGARAMSLAGRLSPKLMDMYGEKVAIPQQSRDGPARDPEGALHAPGVGGHVSGDHPGHVMRRSLYTRAALHPVATGVALAFLGLAVSALLSRERV